MYTVCFDYIYQLPPPSSLQFTWYPLTIVSPSPLHDFFHFYYTSSAFHMYVGVGLCTGEWITYQWPHHLTAMLK